MRRAVRPLVAVLLLSCATGLNAAAPRPVIPGFERLHSAEKYDAARAGQLLLNELNCVACHQGGDPAIARKQAPILDHVSQRVRVGHLRKFLLDPQAVKPGTTMPNLFAEDPQREQKVEALVHFLASSGSPRQERPDSKTVNAGRDAYHKLGCVACHGSRTTTGDPEKVLPSSVPLGDLKGKYTLASLSSFLAEPHAVRPSGRMPRLLNAKEAKDVANYLLQGVKVDLSAGKGGANYRYYEGSWDKIPDFSKLKPKASGIAGGFDLGVARRGSDFGVQFEAVLKIDREEEYRFTLHSDDGSRLLIDGKLVVNNDGIHAPQSVSGKTRLTKGIHHVVIDFIQGGGGAELDATIEAPGFGTAKLGDIVAVSEAALEKKPAPKVVNEDAFEFKPELAKQGRALFASAGCASCHQMQDNKKPIASELMAPALKQPRNEGCLSAKPAKGRPWFALDTAQVQAIQASLKNPPAEDRTPAGIVSRTLTTFNCYACHSRDKIGGRDEELDKFFQTTQPEMGEEGRLPPPLDGIGGKLKPDYFKNLLDKGVDERGYMHTRMPGFGLANVGHLVEAFAALDKTPKVKPVTFTETPGRIKSVGRHLTGNEAFGCIKCHTFNGIKAEGVQGIDMTVMPKKLQPEWFRAYVLDPQSFRPGTRMPSAFLEGKSPLTKILDGTPDAQTEAIWQYLQDGSQARPPVGSGSKSIPLIPKDGAVIYRNFIQGAGARAIGVGYPEKIHLAFDANELRLALLWQGAFIDAARHWTDRGVGFEGPLGDNVLGLPGGVPFALLANPKDAWPGGAAKNQGYRFLGYRLTPDDRPTFLYAMNEVRFEDFPIPTSGKELTLKRQIDVKAEQAVENLRFRAAVGSKIEPQKDGWYRIDGAWRIRIEGPEPVVREVGGKSELLVPVVLREGKARLVVEYAW